MHINSYRRTQTVCLRSLTNEYIQLCYFDSFVFWTVFLVFNGVLLCLCVFSGEFYSLFFIMFGFSNPNALHANLINSLLTIECPSVFRDHHKCYQMLRGIQFRSILMDYVMIVNWFMEFKSNQF